MHIGGKVYNVDVRADGGYIMPPGAKHPDAGREFVEAEPWTAELIAQAPLYDPTWPPDERKEEERKAKSASEGERQYQFDDEDEFVAQHFHNIAVPPDERRRQVEVYLTAVPGTTQGTGDERACIALTMRLLWGFALAPSVVSDLLYEWGQKEDQLNDADGWYPWSQDEIHRKVDWCINSEYRGRVR
jgi:hypothetical protein